MIFNCEIELGCCAFRFSWLVFLKVASFALFLWEMKVCCKCVLQDTFHVNVKEKSLSL